MIRVEREGPVWTLTLDRAHKANALTGEMLAAIAEAATEAAETARVLILTATGSVFSAGADLDEVGKGLATDPVWERASGAVAAFPGGRAAVAVPGAVWVGAPGSADASGARCGYRPW